MGFASYDEDIVSRFNHDNFRGRSQSVPAKKVSVKKEVIMNKLKEFTVSTARPLPVILLADISGSMDEQGKIQSLNQAVREMIESFRDEDDLRAEIHLAVITFGSKRMKSSGEACGDLLQWDQAERAARTAV